MGLFKRVSKFLESPSTPAPSARLGRELLGTPLSSIERGDTPMAGKSAAIATTDLSKRYRDVLAVSDLNLNVRRGEIYALLGRNGAGKTTTIRMLLGLIQPTAGQVEVLGRRLRQGVVDILARVGYLVETATAYPNLTVRENLEIQRRLLGAEQSSVSAAIKLMRLEAYADRRFSVLSLGNKQRVGLARAMLHKPDLLILDEPASALDPAGVVEIRSLLRRLAINQGITVFISSHILSEIAQLADRIGIVHEGRLLEELDRDELQGKGRSYVQVGASDLGRAAKLLAAAGFDKIKRSDRQLRIFGAEDRTPEIARIITRAGIDLTELSPRREDLESYFLRLTGGVK